jgi:hypothetical protein
MCEFAKGNVQDLRDAIAQGDGAKSMNLLA